MPEQQRLSAEDVRILSFRAQIPMTVLRDAQENLLSKPVANITVMRRRTELEQELALKTTTQEVATIWRRLDEEEDREILDFDNELRRMAVRKLIELYRRPVPSTP